MAQHDYSIANQSGAAFRSDLNNALAAIVSQNSGATAPATTYAYQWWADTTNNNLKLRNSANNAWIEIMQLDGTLTMEDGTAALPGLAFRDDLDTGIFRADNNQLGISSAGVERVEFGASEVVFNDSGANYDFRIEGDTNANLFFVDASADAVGIGTSSPGRKLVVAGDLNTVVAVEGSTNGTSNLFLGDTADEDVCALSYNHVTNSLGITVNASASPAVTIDSSSRVGIGTQSPSSTLAVGGNPPVSGAIGAVGSAGGISLALSDNINSSLYVRTATGGAIIGTDAGNAIRFATSGNDTANEKARIDSSGRLLVGTSTARANFFNSTLSANLQIEGTNHDSSNICVVRDSANAFGAIIVIGKSRGPTVNSNAIVSDGDEIGQINFQAADGTEMVEAASIACQIDGTPGANDMPGRLVFSVSSDGSASPTERVRLNNGGGLHVSNTGGFIDSAARFHELTNRNDTSGDRALTLGLGANTNNTSSYFLYCTQVGTADRYFIFGNGTTGTPSDNRLKKNIETTRDGYLEDINQLRVVKYNWNEQEDGEPKELGLIAQELEQVFPGMIQEGPEQPDGNSYKAVKTSVLPFILLKALQEATAKIEALEARLSALESA